MSLSIKVMNGVEEGQTVLLAHFSWVDKADRSEFDKCSDFFKRQAFCGDQYDLEFSAEARWGDGGNSISVRSGGEVWQDGCSCVDVWNRAGFGFLFDDDFAGVSLRYWQAEVSVSIMTTDLAMLFKLAFQDETTSVEQVYLDPLPEGFA